MRPSRAVIQWAAVPRGGVTTRLLVLGASTVETASLVREVDDLVVDRLAGPDGLQQAVAAAPAVALWIGPELDESATEAFAEAWRALADEDRARLPLVVTGPAASSSVLGALEPPPFYRSTGSLPTADLASVLAAARRPQDTASPPDVDDGARQALDSDLAACRGFRTGLEQLRRALATTLEADHADVWVAASGAGPLRDGSSRVAGLDAGLLGFVARTGGTAVLDRLDEDPRFAPSDVAPGLTPGPAVVAGHDDVIAGRPVVVALHRRAGSEPFPTDTVARLGRLVDGARPHLARWAAAEEAQATMVAGARNLYRDEALDAYAEGTPTEGDLLRADPGWTRATYRLLLAFLVLALVFSFVARVGEHAAGPAVVRAGDRLEVTARVGATVAEVLVVPHQAVRVGDLLVRLHSPSQTADVTRLEAELALRLRQRLRDPSDRSTEQPLIDARHQLEVARVRRDDFLVRAPAAGRVSDVRMRVGQPLDPGTPMLTLVRDGGALSVRALIAGEALPTLVPGQRLRFELTGYPGVYRTLTVTSVGQEVIGPAEARRTLEGVIADAVPITGPVVVVDARLDGATFQSDGRTLVLRDGMHGRAEVRIRSRPLLFELIPGLETLFARGRRG